MLRDTIARDWIDTDVAAVRADVARLGVTGAARRQVELAQSSDDKRWRGLTVRALVDEMLDRGWTTAEIEAVGEVIRYEIAACEAAAREQGWDGERYELTEQDCLAIVEAVGRKPTREEWAAAGVVGIGSGHVGEVRP